VIKNHIIPLFICLFLGVGWSAMGQATITGASYKDTDGDGTVDRIDVVYSADISGSTFEAGDGLWLQPV
jgi:hypothetical protein